jgi:hypothetical protein
MFGKCRLHRLNPYAPAKAVDFLVRKYDTIIQKGDPPMPEFTNLFGASRTASTLLVLFIPSKDRHGRPIDQDRWVREALGVLGEHFRGATAFPKGLGVWRDDDQGGKLLFDEPVVIQCYTSEEVLLEHAKTLKKFLERLGKETRQGAVGLVIDQEYLEIRFKLRKKGD